MEAAVKPPAVTKAKVMNYMAWTVIVCSILTMLSFGYLYFIDGYPPVTFGNEPFPTNKTEYLHGEHIVLTMEYCKKKNYPAVSQVAFADGLMFLLPETEHVSLPLGCNTVRVDAIEIPEKLPDGEYYLRGSVTYYVNVLKTYVVTWQSQRFVVSKGNTSSDR